MKGRSVKEILISILILIGGWLLISVRYSFINFKYADKDKRKRIILHDLIGLVILLIALMVLLLLEL